jgi:hypothetical protein
MYTVHDPQYMGQTCPSSADFGGGLYDLFLSALSPETRRSPPGEAVYASHQEVKDVINFHSCATTYITLTEKNVGD